VFRWENTTLAMKHVDDGIIACWHVKAELLVDRLGGMHLVVIGRLVGYRVVAAATTFTRVVAEWGLTGVQLRLSLCLLVSVRECQSWGLRSDYTKGDERRIRMSIVLVRPRCLLEFEDS